MHYMTVVSLEKSDEPYLHPVCLLNFSRLKDLKCRFWGIIW